jgi:hypothetical protein
LANLTHYHWRYRVIDSSNDASDWTAFGENPEGDADFYLDGSYYVAGHVENGGGGGGGCGGSVISSKGFSLVGILALLGGLLLAAGFRRRIWTA